MNRIARFREVERQLAANARRHEAAERRCRRDVARLSGSLRRQAAEPATVAATFAVGLGVGAIDPRVTRGIGAAAWSVLRPWLLHSILDGAERRPPPAPPTHI